MEISRLCHTYGISKCAKVVRGGGSRAHSVFLAGLAASSSKIRFWDVAAFNLFARIPFDVSMIIFLIPKVRSVMGLLADGSVNTALKYPITVSAIGLVSMLFFLWYIFWSYKAFAESTNLKNGKGVGIFIVCFIVAYVISMLTELGSVFLNSLF